MHHGAFLLLHNTKPRSSLKFKLIRFAPHEVSHTSTWFLSKSRLFFHCLHSLRSLTTHPMLLSYWLSPMPVVSRATWVLGIRSFRVSHRSVFVIGHWRESGSLRLSVDHVGNNVQLRKKKQKNKKQAPTLSGSSLTRPWTLHAVSWLLPGRSNVCVQPHFKGAAQWTLDLRACSVS